MGCFVRCDTAQPVMFFLHQTDAPKTLGCWEEAVRIQGAEFAVHQQCKQEVLSVVTGDGNQMPSSHRDSLICKHSTSESTCPCVVWWGYRIFGHDVPSYHHELCIRLESFRAHSSPIWSKRLPSFHIYICACHKQVKLWRHRRHSSATPPSHWGQTGTDGRADGTDIRDADTLLCLRISYLLTLTGLVEESGSGSGLSSFIPQTPQQI